MSSASRGPGGAGSLKPSPAGRRYTPASPLRAGRPPACPRSSRCRQRGGPPRGRRPVRRRPSNGARADGCRHRPGIVLAAMDRLHRRCRPGCHRTQRRRRTFVTAVPTSSSCHQGHHGPPHRSPHASRLPLRAPTRPPESRARSRSLRPGTRACPHRTAVLVHAGRCDHRAPCSYARIGRELPRDTRTSGGHAFPLPRSAADSLQRAVGGSIELVDIRDADGLEGIVIVSSVSRQLLGKLRTAFPQATLLVVEVEDEGHRIHLAGPVMRALDAGANGYAIAGSVDELGEAITRAATASDQELASEAIALSAAADDQLEGVLDGIIRDRS